MNSNKKPIININDNECYKCYGLTIFHSKWKNKINCIGYKTKLDQKVRRKKLLELDDDSDTVHHAYYVGSSFWTKRIERLFYPPILVNGILFKVERGDAAHAIDDQKDNNNINKDKLDDFIIEDIVYNFGIKFYNQSIKQCDFMKAMLSNFYREFPGPSKLYRSSTRLAQSCKYNAIQCRNFIINIFRNQSDKYK